MKNSCTFAVVILLALLVGVGCGSSSSVTPPPALAISLGTAPPTSLAVNATATIAATVTNDSANGGVDWSCTPAATCGTFTPAHTASGATTTYKAPAAAASVTIVAASTTTSSVTASAAVTITAPAITVTLVSPPTSLVVNATATIAATVTNDTAGVDWSCTPATTCGTFTPAHTATGVTTTYKAPAAAGAVTITAASTTTSTIKASANVTITAPAITVTLSTAPPASLVVNATASIAATTNDSAGVDWSCTPVGTCGTFTPAHTASTVTTSYTAPAAAGPVTIVAASTTTSTIKASANVAITPTLVGTFVFFARGLEANSTVYSLAGEVTLTANGTVTGGEQDFNDGTAGNKSPAGGDSITGGSYTLGIDGRGTLTLITNNSNLGVAGTETLDIVRVNSMHVLIEEFDASATSIGSMDLQSPVVAGLSSLSGTYSFAVGGKLGTTTEGFGGIITITGSGTLHTTIDINEGGTTITRGATSIGTYTAQDPLGRGTITFGGNTFVYYAVLADATRTKAFRLIVTNSGETDLGSAFAQAPNATFSPATITGKYAFVESGNHGNTGGFVIGGQFSADGAGKVTSGAADESEGGTPDATVIGGITGTYTMPANGVGALTIAWSNDSHTRGMYPTDPGINLLDLNNATGSGGAVLLSLDAHVGDGVLVQQGTTGLPSGSFGFNFQAFTNAGEVDSVGQVTFTGTSLTGFADVNDLFHAKLTTGATLSGTLTADAANPGRFTLPLTLTIGGTPTVQTIVLYQISSNQFVVVQLDLAQFGSGVVEKQQ
jgi:hypothetical protein